MLKSDHQVYKDYLSWLKIVMLMTDDETLSKLTIGDVNLTGRAVRDGLKALPPKSTMSPF